MAICDAETAVLLPRYPKIVTVAGCPLECDWIAAQVAASGVQVQVAACWAVNLGWSSGSSMHSRSIAPMRILSPFAST